MKTISFIGTGNMGGACATVAAKAVGPENVVLTNRTISKAENLGRQLNCKNIVSSNVEAAKLGKFIVLCVKPQFLELVCSEIKDTVMEESKSREIVIVSVAAGKTISFYEKFFPSIPIIRTLPNTPCSIGKGMTLIVPNNSTKQQQVAEYMKIMEGSGKLKIIPENQMEAAGTVSGCTPAFVFEFIEALSDGAVLKGVPRADAIQFASQAVMGAAALVLESGKHPGQLKDEVCSPGGTTICGCRALEERGFRSTAINAICAAVERTYELAK